MMEWKRACETDCDLSFCNSKALELNTLALFFLSPLRGHRGLVDSAVGDFLGPQVPNEGMTPTTHQDKKAHTRSVDQVLGCCCCCKVASVVSDSVLPHRRQPTRLPRPWDSSGKNTGVGSLSLLQGIFPTQGSNSGLPHCGCILYCLNHQGSP